VWWKPVARERRQGARHSTADKLAGAGGEYPQRLALALRLRRN
jgi:hypothetical protein